MGLPSEFLVSEVQLNTTKPLFLRLDEEIYSLRSFFKLQ